MVCRCTQTPRPGRCMDSTHRFFSSNIATIIVSFRSRAVLARYVSAPSRLSWFLFIFFPPFFLFRCPVPAPSRRVVLDRPALLRARSQGCGQA